MWCKFSSVTAVVRKVNVFLCAYWNLENSMFPMFSLLYEGIRAELCNEGTGGDENVMSVKRGSYVS